VQIVRGRKQSDLSEALVAVSHSQLPRHPARLLTVLARQKNEPAALLDARLQQIGGFVRGVGRHLRVDFIDVDHGAVVLQDDRGTHDKILVLAGVGQES